ncbi:ubiquitin-conjugating enzyme/RWD-like protein [Zopfochytrium polystomum]|nr:ubiquitin-conjugating enzyme/RWD-like protein [Zopfochytrium polystomum]
MALRRIQKELGEVVNNPSKAFSAGPAGGGDDLFKWEAVLFGPANSPFRDGAFKVSLDLSTDYPFKPPKVKFLTKIYHPNVDDDGSICIGVLKPDVWKPSNKLTDVLLSLSLILEFPIPEDAINGSVAEVYTGDRAKFDKTAQEWVKKYCTK